MLDSAAQTRKAWRSWRKKWSREGFLVGAQLELVPRREWN